MSIIKSPHKNIKGYTLVSMAIAVGVFGLIVAGAAKALVIYYHDQKIETATNNTAQAVNALSQYLYLNGHYPCPAPLDRPSGTAGYGMPSDCSAVSADTFGTFNATQGLWIEQSQRAGIGKVVRGAVPFRVLNIPEYEARDSYGNRLAYVVTLGLTDRTTYDSDGGGISFVTELIDYDTAGEPEEVKSVLPVANSLRFLVFSPGKDRIGGYSNEGGIVMLACDMMTSLGRDVENCNTDITDPEFKAIYYYSAYADLGIDLYSHYDDFVDYSFLPGLPFWMVTDEPNSNNIWFDNTNSGALALGYTDNETILDIDLALNVKGDLKVEGAIHTDYLCDSSSGGRYSSSNESYCIPIKEFFSASAECVGANEYVTSIDMYAADGIRLNCTTGVITEFRCPSGQVMVGIDTDIDGVGPDEDEGILCAYPPAPAVDYNENTACSDYDVNVCIKNDGSAVRTIIPAAAHGDYQQTTDILQTADIPLGMTYKATYKCDNRNWIYQSSTGSCDNRCLATEDLEFLPFAFNNPTFGGPKDGWTGIWNATISIVCPENIISVASALAPDQIVCEEGSVEEVIEDCASGKTGTVNITREWRCSPPGWVEISNSGDGNCTDTLVPAPDPALECPEGLTENAGACDTCVGTIDQTRERDVTCSSGDMGTMTEERTYDCVTRKWSPWIKVEASACVPFTFQWYAPDDTNPLAKLGPFKDKGSSYAVGDVCTAENENLRRSCYSVYGTSADGRELYYQYKDCICE